MRQLVKLSWQVRVSTPTQRFKKRQLYEKEHSDFKIKYLFDQIFTQYLLVYHHTEVVDIHKLDK